MKMNISTPELRATIARTGTLTDASHWSRAVLSATFIAFSGFAPLVLVEYGHRIFGPLQGSWFQWLLVSLSALEALVFIALFLVLPCDKKAFAARVQSLWLVLWPVHTLGFASGIRYYAVVVLLYCPLLLAISLMGPAKVAQIPCIGPRFVRLVFGKPRCLRMFGCTRKAESEVKDNHDADFSASHGTCSPKQGGRACSSDMI